MRWTDGHARDQPAGRLTTTSPRLAGLTTRVTMKRRLCTFVSPLPGVGRRPEIVRLTCRVILRADYAPSNVIHDRLDARQGGGGLSFPEPAARFIHAAREVVERHPQMVGQIDEVLETGHLSEIVDSRTRMAAATERLVRPGLSSSARRRAENVDGMSVSLSP